MDYICNSAIESLAKQDNGVKLSTKERNAFGRAIKVSGPCVRNLLIKIVNFLNKRLHLLEQRLAKGRHYRESTCDRWK